MTSEKVRKRAYLAITNVLWDQFGAIDADEVVMKELALKIIEELDKEAVLVTTIGCF